MKARFNLQDKRKKETYIYLKYNFAGRPYSWSTGEMIQPRFWSDNTRRIVRSYVGYEKINILLNEIARVADDFFVDAKTKGQVPSNDDLTEHMNKSFSRKVEKQAEKVDDVISFLSMYINERQAAKKLTEGTIEHYRQLKKHLVGFSVKKKDGKLPFESINLGFFHDFVAYLYSQPGRDGDYMKTNTVSKITSKLTQVLNDALERGYTSNAAHKSKKFRVAPKPTDKDYFTFDQLVELYHCDIKTNYCELAIKELKEDISSSKLTEQQQKIANARVQSYEYFLETGIIPAGREKYFDSFDTLERVRDSYIMESFTGTRFSDFGTIKKEYFSEVEGVTVMQFRTKKSQYKVEVVIPIHPIVKLLFEKYSFQAPTSMLNQPMNRYIKQVLEVAGFNEVIHYYDDVRGKTVEKVAAKFKLGANHQTRRNFITNALDAGVSMQDIMNITGIKRVETIMKYYRGKRTASALRVANSAFFSPERFLKRV